MRIALSGYYGFDNAGDEALLKAITSSIRRLAPEAEFVVFSGAPEKTSSEHGVQAVYYKNPFKVWLELCQSDLLISGGGSIFQDVTSPRSLPYYISVVALAKLAGIPVIFYAQGVGPINRYFSQFLMRLVGNRADMITLRDEKSLDLLWEMGIIHPPLLVTADPVFSLQPSAEAEQRVSEIFARHDLTGQPLVGVAVRQWQPLEGYQAPLARVLDNLAGQGYKIVFIPMAYPEDVGESRRVADLMQQPALVLDENLKSQEHLALMGHMRLVISIRLHALIFAANRGVPFAGISYDPKVEAFLDSFGRPPLPTDYAGMMAQVEELLQDQQLQSEISSIAAEMRSKALENARLALDLIKSRTRGKRYE